MDNQELKEFYEKNIPLIEKFIDNTDGYTEEQVKTIEQYQRTIACHTNTASCYGDNFFDKEITEYTRKERYNIDILCNKDISDLTENDKKIINKILGLDRKSVV